MFDAHFAVVDDEESDRCDRDARAAAAVSLEFGPDRPPRNVDVALARRTVAGPYRRAVAVVLGRHHGPGADVDRHRAGAGIGHPYCRRRIVADRRHIGSIPVDVDRAAGRVVVTS